jgi:predicted O-methyltransferase YrrM
MDYWQMQQWLETLLPARPPELARMEEYARTHDFPIIGALSGQLCYLLARIHGARRIFELGSGYGYSTAWFAQAVTENQRDTGSDGRATEVHHCVWDEALSQQARTHLAALGYSTLVQFHVGEAVATLQGMDGLFDLILMDIQKTGYPVALPVIEQRLHAGGLLIVDNMLWDGRSWDSANSEPETEAIRLLARLVSESPRWSSSIVPLRDGLLVARYSG